MMRRDPRVIREWSEKNVQQCATRQKNILNDLMSALKPGGFLLYSTCTYEEEENEDQVRYLLESGFAGVDIPDMGHFPELTIIPIHSATAYRFDLHKTTGSGFFCCLLQKDGSMRANTPYKEAHYHQQFSLKRQPELIGEWLQHHDNFAEAESGHITYALPKELVDPISELARQVKIISAGITIGQLKNTVFSPAHPLALSVDLSVNTPSLSLQKEEALKYLRKESWIPQSILPKGWLLVKYMDLGIGWVKVLPDGRINNYLPPDWRILR